MFFCENKFLIFLIKVNNLESIYFKEFRFVNKSRFIINFFNNDIGMFSLL